MDELTWDCTACRQPVADGDGLLQIRMRDVAQAERAMAAWQARRGDKLVLSSADLHDVPDPARWQITHHGCAGGEDTGTYSIEVHRIRTARMLLGWTSHLMEKDWFAHTNWSQLLRDHAGGEGPGTA